jgi:hypothetical protein
MGKKQARSAKCDEEVGGGGGCESAMQYLVDIKALPVELVRKVVLLRVRCASSDHLGESCVTSHVVMGGQGKRMEC